MSSEPFVERVKIALGITGIPAASADDVMREARSGTLARTKVQIALGVILGALGAALFNAHDVIRTVAGSLLVLIGALALVLRITVIVIRKRSSQPKI